MSVLARYLGRGI